MKASVVIGANYGDEGKGLITDYLASREPSAVVRFNGGAQAGHTVITPDGKRHVFHHFGSGTFVESPTYLSSYFVLNPIIFVQEMTKILKYQDTFSVMASDDCPVTTPYDIMLNQAIEKMRGEGRHGSCGLGFNETLQRHGDWPYRLTFRHLRSRPALEKILKLIRTEYVPKRAEALGIKTPITNIEDEGILEHFVEDCQTLRHNVESGGWIGFLEDLGDIQHIVFEGAQGLLLDMDSGVFPYVTRSNTGFKNALALIRRGQIEDVDLYYVSRTYLTRHGEGPLANEDLMPLSFRDDTNVENEHQGELRFALLDPPGLVDRIKSDFSTVHPTPERMKTHFALTCADQTNNVVMGLIPETPGNAEPFAKDLTRMISGSSYLISRGPTRNDVKEIHL